MAKWQARKRPILRRGRFALQGSPGQLGVPGTSSRRSVRIILVPPYNFVVAGVSA